MLLAAQESAGVGPSCGALDCSRFRGHQIPFGESEAEAEVTAPVTVARSPRE